MLENAAVMAGSVGSPKKKLRRSGRGAAALLAAAGAAVLGGCNADSWFDPSVHGRWEDTPTTMPILDRIAAIEDKTPDLVETSPPVREDLIAEAQQYRLGPSDQIEIRISNFETVGMESQYPREVDQRGYITIPRIGQIYVLGKTNMEAEQTIARVIGNAQILQDPQVTVIVLAARQQTFSVIGGVRNPGVYLVNKPDYRLLDVIAAAGGIDESTEKIYIVRQIALSDAATGRIAAPPAVPSTQPQSAPPVDIESLENELDRLTNPPSGSPGVMGKGRTLASGERRASTYTGMQPEPQPAPSAPQPAPPIDLIDSDEPTKATAPQPTPPPTAAPQQPTAPTAKPTSTRPRSRWAFVNGQWTMNVPAAAPVVPAAPTADPLANQPLARDLMTQRVIEVPVKPLIAGQSDVNVVIRPGDVVRVPTAASGVVYVGGQISRPGTFMLPATGKLTLLRAIDAAGGLSQLGIPERVELTRIVGSNREATILLNMRAIAERTQPDVILKADDRINVGTNFWAFPLAIIRNGFRMSYGFGFLIDRNFGNDIFGAPPDSRFE